MKGLVPTLQFSPAQPRPLQSPMWSPDWMVLTWTSVEEKGGDKEWGKQELGVEVKVVCY